MHAASVARYIPESLRIYTCNVDDMYTYTYTVLTYTPGHLHKLLLFSDLYGQVQALAPGHIFVAV